MLNLGRKEARRGKDKEAELQGWEKRQRLRKAQGKRMSKLMRDAAATKSSSRQFAMKIEIDERVSFGSKETAASTRSLSSPPKEDRSCGKS
jgi:hypothetical protein